jgi:pimeloyl-ACP methyl ester carboxylesterase
MPYETRRVDVGGRRTRVLEAGRGEPLLLIHAFPLSADLWKPQLDAPPPGWRLIAPDLRGFGAAGLKAGGSVTAGASTNLSTDLSMDDYAADLEDLAAALTLDSVTLAGLSMGGYIIFAVLRRRRLRVRALVLADTRAEADTDEGRAGRRKMMALVDEEGPAAIAREMIPKLVGETTRRERPAVVATVRELIAANSSGAIRAALAAVMARPDSTPLLGSITAPTLVIVGEEDVLTPPASAEKLHTGIRASTLARIPRAGHLSSLERPDAFNAELSGFLNLLRSPA